MKAASGDVSAAAGEVVQFGDVRVLTRKVDDLDAAALRDLADSLKSTLGRGVVVLGAAADDKVQFVMSVTSDLTGRVHAGKLVKQLAPMVGGGGGGRPDFAQAGGTPAGEARRPAGRQPGGDRAAARILKFAAPGADTLVEDHACLEDRLRARASRWPSRRLPRPAAAQIYAWQDADGNQVFSDRTPSRRVPHLRRARLVPSVDPPGDGQGRQPLRQHHRRSGRQATPSGRIWSGRSSRWNPGSTHGRARRRARWA